MPATRCSASATRCTQFYREHDIAALQRLCFRAEHFPEQAMSVQEATEAFVGNRVDYLPLVAMQGPDRRRRWR